MACDVSVIIPTYNSSCTLKRALDSVRNQSLLPREIVVVDDGSDDWRETERIARSYSDGVSVCFARLEENMGASVARNVGIQSASCRYVSFLDSDEAWLREKLEIQYTIMLNAELDFSMHGLVEQPNHAKRKFKVRNDSDPRWYHLSTWSLLIENHCTSSVMALRQKMVLFDPTLRRIEDWKCWMEMLASSRVKGAYIRSVLAERFKPALGASGLSRDVKAMHLSRMMALNKLSQEGRISGTQYVVGICMEALKYPVRILSLSAKQHLSLQSK